MANINNEFTNNTVWSRIGDLKTNLASRKGAKGSLDLAVIQKLQALGDYLEIFKNNFYLAPMDWSTKLSLVTQNLDQILNQLASWTEGALSPQAQNLINASVESCVIATNGWPIQKRNSKAEAAEAQAIFLLDQIAHYRDEQTRILDRITTENQSLRAEIDATKSAYLKETDELAKLKADLKTTVSDMPIEAKKELADEALVIKREYSERLESIVSDAGIELNKITDLLKDAESIAALSAGEVLSDGYQKYALKLEKTRTSWQQAGFSIAVSGLIALVFILFGESPLDITMQYLLKSSIALTVGGLAAYSFRQASLLGRAAEVAHYRHLDSIALSTYVKGLKSEDTIIAIQEELGKRLATERSQLSTAGPRDDTKMARQLVKSLENVINQISKK